MLSIKPKHGQRLRSGYYHWNGELWEEDVLLNATISKSYLQYFAFYCKQMDSLSGALTTTLGQPPHPDKNLKATVYRRTQDKLKEI